MLYETEKKQKKRKTKKEIEEENRKKEQKQKAKIKEQHKDFNYIMGSIISRLRKEKGMSIEELANRIDETPEYVEKCEKGQIPITILNMLDFCIVFDKSITRMLSEVSFSTILWKSIL